VLVNVGDTVSPGQLVATLESMKMEVQVLSSRGGRVREVRVRPGDFVNVGDPIIVLE
jgi:acetyl-CoA carboxylase biotin carboxyl carrier protein